MATDAGNGRAAGVASEPQSGVFWFGGDPRWQPPGDGAPLTRTVHADVCVVGGGFSGLWTAYWLKRLAADAEVVLLEREFCGAGASGRNGGWVNGWEDSIGTLVSRFGAESAGWLLEASVAGADAMREAVRDGAIDCDLSFEGALIVALSQAQLDGLADLPLAAERIGRGELIKVLSADEAQEACGSPRAVGGLLLTRAGSVQPALLVQGLRRLAVEAGVRVFEASPMTRLERSLPAVVETPAGEVVADQVVLTCGPWLAGLGSCAARCSSSPRTWWRRRPRPPRSTPWAGVADDPSPTPAPRSTTVSGPATTAWSLGAAAGASALAGASYRRTSTTGSRSRRSSPICTTCCRGRARRRSSGSGADRSSAPSTALPG